MTSRDLLIKFLLTDATFILSNNNAAREAAIDGALEEISDLVDRRIYPLRLPQKATLPALVVTGISNLPIANLRTQASADEPRFQIDSWGTTQKTVDDLNSAVRTALEAFVGFWTVSGSPETDAFVQVQFITDRDFFEEDILGGLCRKSADYFVWNTRGAAVLT